MDYLLLLRGINVGGNNHVAMPKLKKMLTEAGFKNVDTYINSGNIFIMGNVDQLTAERMVTEVLKKNFDFAIDFRLISKEAFLLDLKQAPDWWGQDKELRHNAVFKLNDYKAVNDDWLKENATEDYDKVLITPNIIFWTSTKKKDHSKSFYSKIVGSDLYKQTTARNFNTTKKIEKMFAER